MNIADDLSRKKADIILLSGFLGSGKTTLLKQILGWETDLAGTVVVVNEFGDVGIDGALLKDSGSNIVELTSGCICCTLTADLKRSMAKLWGRFRPKRILIESSGVADPTSISKALSEPGLRANMTLKKIITVLDADFWEAREAFGPLFYNQLEMADLILLNKIDLLEKGKVPIFLSEIHATIPDSQVVPTIRCRVDPETLWTAPRSKLEVLKPLDFFKKQLDHHSVDADNYVTFAFETAYLLDETRFRGFIDKLPFEVFRVKGPVRFPDRTVMFNFVGGRGEWLPWQPEPRTQLAFIGWNITKEENLERLRQCIVEQ
jgi:G3E family GTPase